ncbi:MULTISPECIES: hypothetical protein [Campylobacter]
MNFSKSGTSTTIGIKDTSINTGKKLFFLNTVIPLLDVFMIVKS